MCRLNISDSENEIIPQKVCITGGETNMYVFCLL